MWQYQIGSMIVLLNTKEAIDAIHHYTEYIPAAGLFICTRHTSKRSRGELLGRTDDKGYLRFCVGGIEDKTHRWAYLYMVGLIPDGMVIDHINRCPFDNRWENLRLATVSENNYNRKFTKAFLNPHLGFVKDLEL